MPDELTVAQRLYPSLPSAAAPPPSSTPDSLLTPNEQQRSAASAKTATTPEPKPDTPPREEAPEPERNLAAMLYPDLPNMDNAQGGNADTVDEQGNLDPAMLRAAQEAYSGIELPEGIVADDPVTQFAFVELHKRGIGKEHAKGLIDLHDSLTKSMQQAEHSALKKVYAEQARKDPELNEGGFDQNIARARDLVEQYADPELKHYLRNTPIGSWKPFLRFLVRIA